MAFSLVATLAVAGCFENEPAQRKAFIDFLQTRIIDRSGVHVPLLSDDETKAFGDYAKHYAVITGFTADAEMTTIIQKLVQGLPELRSAQSLIEKRAAIRKAGNEMGEALRVMDEKYAKAKAAREALKQPEDLKPVYDKAFDRTVTGPVVGLRESVPLAQAITVAAGNIGDYVAAHSDSVRIVGTNLQAKDKKTQSEVDDLVNALNGLAPKFNDAQKKLKIILQGT
jgi:hypothetical protein